MKCPIKIIALYYESPCPTYFLSTLQPTLLYSDSFLVTWVDVVQDIVFLKKEMTADFIFSLSEFQNEALTDFIYILKYVLIRNYFFGIPYSELHQYGFYVAAVACHLHKEKKTKEDFSYSGCQQVNLRLST